MEISRQRVDVAMARKCWNVKDLAYAYGCTRQRMNVLLNSRNITTTAAGKIANALDVDVIDILED